MNDGSEMIDWFIVFQGDKTWRCTVRAYTAEGAENKLMDWCWDNSVFFSHIIRISKSVFNNKSRWSTGEMR